MDSLRQEIINITSQNSAIISTNGLGWSLDISNSIQIINMLFCISDTAPQYSKIIFIIGIVFCVLVIFSPIENWEKITVLALCMILLPSFSRLYNNLYLLIPLFSFLNETIIKQAFLIYLSVCCLA